MYHHKLCSATYLPLDIGRPQATNLLERPPSNFRSTEPSQETRCPSLKISKFLRQTQPTRSASVLFKQSSKAVKIGHGSTPTSQSPPSHPSPFRSVKRTKSPFPPLLPAFSSPDHDDRRDIKAEKPLPSEPIIDFDKLFRSPVASIRPDTRANLSHPMRPPSRMSVRSFTRDILEAKSAPAHSPFVLQTDGFERKNLKSPCCPVRLSDDEEYQLVITSINHPPVLRPASPCERLSESRKRCRDAPRKTSDSKLLPGKAGWLSRSVGCTSWVDDASSTSLAGSGPSDITAETARSHTQDRAKEHSTHETYGTGMSLVCVFFFTNMTLTMARWLSLIWCFRVPSQLSILEDLSW